MKLASIEVIKNIRNHPSADTLQISEILGWQVIVKKGIHQEGDKVVFITIDTIVPRCQWSEFLVDKKNPDKPIRIKNIKLRNEYSSGLVIPVSEFEPKNNEEVGYDLQSCPAGYDLTAILGIKKYVKEIPANLSGETEGDFPTHIISKTDEDNGLNDPEMVKKVLEQDTTITITQKIDGSSLTIIVENGEIKQVCSRNLAKKDNGKSTFWNCAKNLKIPAGWTGVIQGEMCGNGIQKNRLKLNDIKIFVFQIKVDQAYMTYDTMADFCRNELQCDVVPLIAKLEVASTVKIWENPLQKLQELADVQRYQSGEIGEGIVVRPSSYIKSFESRRPMGFKLINRNYKD
jgi:RNA ligase (TIGR02306 family)